MNEQQLRDALEKCANLLAIGLSHPSSCACDYCDAIHAAEAALANQPTWVKCSERIPLGSDGDDFEEVIRTNRVVVWKDSWSCNFHPIYGWATHWMRTGLVRPEPPKEKVEKSNTNIQPNSFDTIQPLVVAANDIKETGIL